MLVEELSTKELIEKPDDKAESFIETPIVEKNPILKEIKKNQADLEIFKKEIDDLREIEKYFEDKKNENNNTDNTEKSEELERDFNTKPLNQIENLISTVGIVLSKKREDAVLIDEKMAEISKSIESSEMIKSADDFKQVSLRLKSLSKESSLLESDILDIALEYSVLIKNYKERKLSDFGIKEGESTWSLISRKHKEKRGAEGILGIKKMFKKEEILKIEKQIDDMYKLDNLSYSSDSARRDVFFSGSRNYSIYKSVRASEDLVASLNISVIENIAQSLKDIDSEKDINLESEYVEGLKDIYMESFILPKIEKDREGLNDEDYEKVLSCIKESLSIDKTMDYDTSGDVRKKISIFKEKIERMGYTLKEKIEEYWPHQSIDKQLQTALSIINKVGIKDELLEFRNMVNVYNKCVNNYRDLSVRIMIGENLYDNDTDLTKKITSELNADIFKLIENDTEIHKIFSKEQVQKTKDYIQEIYVKELFEIASHQSSSDMAQSIGVGLIKLGDSKYAVPIIMNCFRERGYSDDFPLICDRSYDESEHSFLGNYMENLSQEDIENLKRKNIPGLSEIIDFFHKNPDKTNLFSTGNSLLNEEELKNKKIINENLIKLLNHQANNCNPENLNFYLKLAQNIDGDLGEFYEILKSFKDVSIQENIITMAERRISRFKDLRSYDLLLYMQKNSDEKNIPQIFFNSYNKDVKNESLAKIIRESADIGVLSEDIETKIYSIKLLNELGLDISEHKDYIAKNILMKKLGRNIYSEHSIYFMSLIENNTFDIDPKDATKICEMIIKDMMARNYMSNYSDRVETIKIFYNKNYISEEYYNEALHAISLTDENSTKELLNQEEITQKNWAIGLSRYAFIDGGILHLQEDDATKISELFSNSHPDHREICLNNLQHDWKEFLKTGVLTMDSRFISEVCKRSNGMGDLKYIENISYMIYHVNTYISSEKSNTKTTENLLSKLSFQEERFERERWSEEDKSFFYSVSKDILSTSPSLYTDFLNVFEKLQPRDMKVFIKDYFAAYQAILIVLDKGDNKHDARELVTVRQQIREVMSQIKPGIKVKDIFDKDREKTVEFLKEKFMARYGIIKIPEQFNQEKIKTLENFIKYNANINNKDEKKEATLAFYMALSINGDWQNFREGQDIDLEKYLTGENLQIVKRILSSKVPFEYIKSFDLGIKESEIPAFMKILEDETISSSIGNIETVDIKLGNIKRAMGDLEDVDAYEHEEDRLVLELYKREGKTIAATLSKMFSVNKGQGVLSQKEEGIKTVLSSIYKIEDWNQDEIKRIQESTRGIGLIHGILEKINKENIDEKISDLENIVKPNDKIIEIFTKLDEEFKPNSGAIALSEDLIYLENVIAKNQDKLTEDESKELSDYLENIRNQMKVLEETIDHLKEYFDKLKKSIHGSNKIRLQEKLNEIEKIIYSNNKSINLVSRMTGNLSDIIMNIRQCLGCLSSQCNNDTNLTFGEPYKFLMLSQNGAENESIADQIVMCLPVDLENGEKVMSFVVDTAYGVKSADVLFGNIKTLNKKREIIKQKYPNVKTSVTITKSTLNSVGLATDVFIQRYKKDNPERTIEGNMSISIDVPKSALGDNYAEYGVGGVRPSGKLNLSGVVIQ